MTFAGNGDSSSGSRSMMNVGRESAFRISLMLSLSRSSAMSDFIFLSVLLPKKERNEKKRLMKGNKSETVEVFGGLPRKEKGQWNTLV